jgi:HEAT repeat protein
MAAQQLDLFSMDRIRVEARPSSTEPSINPNALADEGLIGALPDAGLADGPPLAAEAAVRRLAGAVPALEKLCRRLTGFGADRLVPEQAAALEALAKIGGEAARQAVARLVLNQVVQGPTLVSALGVAAQLGSSIPPLRLAPLLRDADPAIRAAACRCVRSAGSHLALLTELLDDLNGEVAIAAAIALGRLGRIEARPVLMSQLCRQPSAEVIEALVPIADQDVIVALGRIARAIPDLAQPVLDALDQIGDCRAARGAEALRTHHSAPSGFS